MGVDNDITQCVKVLDNGGLILYPTDTIWGIGCDATNEKAVEKIYSLKQRPDKKAMVILVASEKDIHTYVQNPDERIFAYLSNAITLTTVIYENAKGVAASLISEDGTIAIRIVEDPFCKTLIERFKKPIVSTSANISGEPYPKNFTEIIREIKNGVDYIVQHRQDDEKPSRPSAIVKLSAEGNIEIIRS